MKISPWNWVESSTVLESHLEPARVLPDSSASVLVDLLHKAKQTL